MKDFGKLESYWVGTKSSTTLNEIVLLLNLSNIVSINHKQDVFIRTWTWKTETKGWKLSFFYKNLGKWAKIEP